MKAIYALYSDPDSAGRAVNSLLAAGAELSINANDIVAASSEPFEQHGLGRPSKGTVMPWITAVGGLIGAASGYELTALTQRAYPLPTGGMPIVAGWTNGIIIYELTMLGAIIATLLTLLISARLPNWSRRLYDPAISDGKILIGVLNPPENTRPEIESVLRQAGAEEIKEFS